MPRPRTMSEDACAECGAWAWISSHLMWGFLYLNCINLAVLSYACWIVRFLSIYHFIILLSVLSLIALRKRSSDELSRVICLNSDPASTWLVYLSQAIDHQCRALIWTNCHWNLYISNLLTFSWVRLGSVHFKFTSLQKINERKQRNGMPADQKVSDPTGLKCFVFVAWLVLDILDSTITDHVASTRNLWSHPRRRCHRATDV